MNTYLKPQVPTIGRDSLLTIRIINLMIEREQKRLKRMERVAKVKAFFKSFIKYCPK